MLLSVRTIGHKSFPVQLLTTWPPVAGTQGEVGMFPQSGEERNKTCVFWFLLHVLLGMSHCVLFMGCSDWKEGEFLWQKIPSEIAQVH